MDIDAITMSDIQYLEAVEKKSFSPLGALYTSVYEDLLSRGLVHLAAEGYIISALGQEMLDRQRASRSR